MNTLSVKDCLSFGWRTFKSRPWIFVSATAVLFFAGMILNIPGDFTYPNASTQVLVMTSVSSIITFLLSFFVVMGKTAFYLRAHDDTVGVELADLWHPHPYWKFLGAALLAGIATVIGLILLIIPGIIIGIMVSFSLYIVIEKGLGPIQALKESARLTKGHRWTLFLLGLSLVAINIVGFCVLFVGLLVTLPISALAVVHAYRTLSRVPAHHTAPEAAA